jgi:branched-chain amino acid transport system ATP-binding protein
MMMPLLDVRELSASYQYVPVLTGLSLSVDKGEIVGVLGRNGVGKSTLLKCILGLVSQRRGKILLNGDDITRQSPMKITRSGIGYAPQGRRLFPHLSVSENLELAPLPARKYRERREELLDQFPLLRERLGQPAGTLSGGQQQILSVARALLLQPSLLLLDEPTEGLDRGWKDEVCGLMNRLRGQGKAMLMVEHDLELAVKICDRVCVAHRGIIVYEGRPENSKAYRDELLTQMGLPS